MAITFLGLLYAQIMYMGNMIKMRDDQFSEGVKRSLFAVSIKLEQDEAKHYLEEDVYQIESSAFNLNTSDVGGVKYSFNTLSGLEADLTIKGSPTQISELQSGNSGIIESYRSMQDVIRSQYLYQKGLIDEVILRILSQSSNRPIFERADSAIVKNYLSSELANNGLHLPFEFAVCNNVGVNMYISPGFDETVVDKDDLFVKALFPGDAANKMYYLKVYFPTKDDYIFSSLKFMIPSFIFTFILLVVFIFTIFLAFRQKKLTEMKNDFINNMTHEFKTPISSISLAAQMLNDDSVRKSPTMMQHITTVINDETKRLRFLVEKVLQMSMFERQKATLKIDEVDANVVIDNVVHTFKLKVEKYGGSIKAELDAMDAIVNVDEMHFTNVIFNLLDNAIKYRREDEALKLLVTTKELPHDKLEITISDNGIGIKKEYLKKIFEKFYRVSTGNRHDVKGFGLGLAYVHKMISEFHGEIKVESELNVGTKFIIILPQIKN